MFDIAANRALLAHHLSGEGVEFGALDGPLQVPQGVKVRYADHMSNEQLKAKYPDLNAIPVDIVLSDSTLDEIGDGSQDFIIANHVIEHLPNPIGALRTWERKLKDNGVLYLSFPIGEYCPDKGRPDTSLKHLLEDDRRGTSNACDEHLLAFILHWSPSSFANPENIRAVLKKMWAEDREMLNDTDVIAPENRDTVASIVEDRDYEVHHHIFTLDTLLGSTKAASSKLQPFDLSLYRGLFNEVIVVFRKSAPSQELDRSFTAAKVREEALSKVIANWIGATEEWRKIADDRLVIIEARAAAQAAE